MPEYGNGIRDIHLTVVVGICCVRTHRRRLPAEEVAASMPSAGPPAEESAAEVEPVAAADAVLDADRLAAVRELEAETGEELLAPAISTYLAEGPEAVAEIRRALDGRDMQAVRQLAHDLGGSSVFLGAARVSGLCNELVEEARSGDADGCRRRVEAVAEELAKATAELEAASPW